MEKKSHQRKPRPADLMAKGKQLHKYKTQTITPEFCAKYTQEFCINNIEIRSAAKDIIKEMILTGKDNPTMVSHIRPNFHIRYADVLELIKEVRSEMKEEATMDGEEVKEKLLNVCWSIIYNNKDIEPKVALQAIQLVAKMVKIFSDTPLQQNNEFNIQLESYNVKELDNMMETIRNIPTQETNSLKLTQKFEEDLQKLKDLEPYIMENSSNFEATKLDKIDDE